MYTFTPTLSYPHADIIGFNLLRRYGRVRLPHMLKGWEVADVEGWNDAALDSKVGSILYLICHS